MNRFAGWLTLFGLLAPIAGWSAEAGFIVRRAELFRHEDRSWGLDADIDYHFSETAVEAMHNGVPLTLVMRLRVKRVRPWWWDETLISENHRRTIRFHPLARAYQLTRAESGVTENFASLHALLEELGRIRNLPVDAPRTLAGGEYRASLSVTLDIESLPLPLRPTAYLSPQWHLNSPWFRWSFAN
ncbi:DUF4390 domain-containing protein [Methylococcus mesophilus]|uniref:DUF4390 domain-containing protein n=1 Tax=Methylococcus mesophilus TaxID=2993564 RepID=UPI00224B729D|nr:DUF4390 domain-containing protein [Methylococcus mesophilus]UZR27845.1 DUF4390 domain-containing protein [Methylococcus mesophilus]